MRVEIDRGRREMAALAEPGIARREQCHVPPRAAAAASSATPRPTTTRHARPRWLPQPPASAPSANYRTILHQRLCNRVPSRKCNPVGTQPAAALRKKKKTSRNVRNVCPRQAAVSRRSCRQSAASRHHCCRRAKHRARDAITAEQLRADRGRSDSRGGAPPAGHRAAGGDRRRVPPRRLVHGFQIRHRRHREADRAVKVPFRSRDGALDFEFVAYRVARAHAARRHDLRRGFRVSSNHARPRRCRSSPSPRPR